jgi:hypothetical protein
MKMEPIKTIDLDCVQVKIYPDDFGDQECPLDCLEGADDIKVLVWDRRSTLSDRNEFKNDDPNDIPGWAFFHGYYSFPLFKYEHGAVVYAVTEGGNPFHCPWDSGQTGWVLVKIIDWKDSTPLTVAESWAKAITTWCNGWYYGFVIEDQRGEHLDSCWGFDDDDYCESEALEIAKHHVEELQTKKARKLEANRPDMY